MLVFFSVLYKPTSNSLTNLLKAKANGLKVVVYLNSVNDNFLKKLNSLDITLLGFNINVGLGIAFSEFENYLELNGYNFFIYFDQDTVVDEIAWRRILGSYKDYFQIRNLGMLNYSGNSDGGSSIVINSGSLFSMNVLKYIGYHDKSFFVEGLDYEFCLRLNSNGLNIVKVLCEGIDHVSLQDGFTIKCFSKVIQLRVYGKQRMIDFNRSHKRLIFSSLRMYKFRFLLFFLKSFIQQNIMEHVSRFFKR